VRQRQWLILQTNFSRDEGMLILMVDVWNVIPSTYRSDISKAIHMLSESGCKEIYLFGSLVNGTHHEGSDIDLAIRGCKPESYYQLIGRLMMELEHPVDLINLDNNTALAQYLELKGDMVRVLH